MRERVLVVVFLLGVPILVGVVVWSTSSPGSSTATATWVRQAAGRARHAGLQHVQCQRDGSGIDCTATNGSASFTIVGSRLNRTAIVVRSP